MATTTHDPHDPHDPPPRSLATTERYPGKRNGLPQSEVYASPSFQASLQPLLDRLRAQNQTDVLSSFPSAREVSKLLCDVLGFLESAYGRYALTKPFPKLPYSVFRDVSAGGGVEILLKHVAGHIKTVTVPVHNRKKIDWTSPALRKELQELVAGVRTELVRAGCVRQFKVYFDKGIKNIEHLTEEKGAVVRLGGVVAGSAKEAGVTHVVVPNAKGMKDGREGAEGAEGEDEEEYFWRTVAKEDSPTVEHALVHWWYLPDSYNEYVPVASAPAEVDADEVPPNGRPWVVHERWVVDSEKYNEWMNEGDYETEESAEENKRVREAKGGVGGGMHEPQRKKAKTKKELRVEEAAMEVGVGVVRVLAPGVVERAVRVVDRKTVEAVHVPTIDLSHGCRQQWMGARRGTVASMASMASSGSDRNRDGDRDRDGKERRRHAIPFAAGWFDKKAVHHIELREFIEFQKEYKGPGWEEYRTMRNHVVDAFGNNPGRRLAFRDVSNDVCADGMLVLKIYKFLDRWGIINRFDLDGAGHDPGNLELATRAGMASILSASKKPFAINEAMELWITGGRHTKTRLRPGTMQQYGVVPTGYIVPEPGKARFCAARPWVRCDGKHYAMSAAKGGGGGGGERGDTSVVTTPLVLCADAYKNGEFPPGTSAKDFVLLDGAPARPEDLAPSNAGTTANKKPFSPQEDLLLLESINKNCQKVGVRGSNGQMQHKPLYDWTAIAKDVSGRNEAECVQRYLEYPIEESLLMSALDFDEGFPLLTLHPEDGSASVPDRYRRAPYNSTETEKGGKKSDVNPLVGNLATILYVIGPEVASDAARHAIESIVEQLAEEGTTGDVKMEEAKAEEARYGVDIGVLRNASFEAISRASVKAQELAHERLMSMYSIVMRMCDVQLERIWEKVDYLEQLVDIGSGVTE